MSGASRGADRTRVALIGAGAWAVQAHLPALLMQKDVDVVGVVDPLIDRARTLAAQHNIAMAVESIDRLLAVQHPDVIVIAAPTEAHPPLVTTALKEGIAVLCEKPLANTPTIAMELAALAESSSALSSVGYSFRYASAMQALKRDIQSGMLGHLWLLEMYEYNAQFHPTRGLSPGWKGDPAHARAGALLEYGSHLIDLANWLAGPIEAAHASLTRVLPQARLDDIATVQVRFQPPAIGILVSGWVLSGSSPGIKIRFHGSEGLAEVELSQAVPGGQAYRRIALDGATEHVPLEESPVSAWAYVQRHIADMLALLHGEPTPYPRTLPTFRDGVLVQQVLEAALIATGGWEAVK